jgi:hypothetical protein
MNEYLPLESVTVVAMGRVEVALSSSLLLSTSDCAIRHTAPRGRCTVPT